MSGAISPLPQYAFMEWCSVKRKHRNKFYIKTNKANSYELDSWGSIPSRYGIIFVCKSIPDLRPN
jgi:hypothetical protein